MERFVLLWVVVMAGLALTGLWSYVSFGPEGWSGGRYIHGDWLINMHGEPVRRGPLGSLILLVADALGVNAIPALTVFMSLVFIVLMGVTLRLVLMLKEPAAGLLLLASPAFFVVFWAAEPNAAFRKDLLIYAALAILVLAVATRRNLLLGVSAGLFTLCAFGHEFALLWLPVFLFVLWSAARDGDAGQFRKTSILLFLVVALTTTWHLSFPSVADVGVICAPLLERGIAPEVCAGSIAFLQDAPVEAQGFVQSYAGSAPLAHFALAYLLSLMPLLAYAWLTRERGLALAVIALCGLPFLPLYVVAVDWGRWMAFHIAAATFVMIHQSLSGRLTLRRAPPGWVTVALVVLATLWSPTTNMEISRGGVLDQIRKTMDRHLWAAADPAGSPGPEV